ncbi:HFR011Cp [Eremothecium sinecaudum]|uniref:Lon protease homolog, mitochondrial n=1 Tax=Eremothecium sinecaudum TaxID=45286 RepID=A0A0X8HU44_9SACH|nr:HFR011Cp [Eremothecium sinecaudum]AMD21866.1 HFR011Cp [Eremothecium sinecaudum]
MFCRTILRPVSRVSVHRLQRRIDSRYAATLIKNYDNENPKSVVNSVEIHSRLFIEEITNPMSSIMRENFDAEWLHSMKLKEANVENNENNEPSSRNEEEKNPEETSIEESSNIMRDVNTSTSFGGTAQRASNNLSSNDDDNKGWIAQGNRFHPRETYPPLIVLSVRNRPLFPGFYNTITIKNPQLIEALKRIMEKNQPYVSVFLVKESEKDLEAITDINEVHDIGVFAQITSLYEKDNLQESGITVLLYAHRRVRLHEVFTPLDWKYLESEEKYEANNRDNVNNRVNELKVTGPTDYLRDLHVATGTVSNVEDIALPEGNFKKPALTNSIFTAMKSLASIDKSFNEQIASFAKKFDFEKEIVAEDAGFLADFAACCSHATQEELQGVLATADVGLRLEKSWSLLRRELLAAELQVKLNKEVDDKITFKHREYLLMEKLKAIKAELGLTDGREKLLTTFRDRMAKLNPPENVLTIFNEESAKLASMETQSSEFTVVRNYLDWLSSIPWGISSEDQFSVPEAEKILNEDHYGMQDVKARILEFIAVGKLLGRNSGKILCFVGPPGVGKTSIGKSIASSLNRKFHRVSVGGMNDVSEIKGHRRTYVGALPGRIMHALKMCRTMNPLILIDEIDKIGSANMHGDPTSALLETLDPEQNKEFLDNYLDTAVDLSNVLFICTANTLDTLPRPLLDRMEVIELSGYVAEEKLKIAERYLSPAAKKATGLEDVDVTITSGAIMELNKKYCRESGVRNLKNQIEKIYRKTALKIVQEMREDSDTSTKTTSEVGGKPHTASKAKGKEIPIIEDSNTKKLGLATSDEPPSRQRLKIPKSVSIVITEENLKEFVGSPIFSSERMYEKTVPGIAMGLAWTSMGGCSMYVESVLQQPLSIDSTPSLERTGQLGDVMKESSMLAYSFSRMYLSKKFPENRFFEKASIHLHCPEGATPKDGPSAGITMASSLISLALNRPIDAAISMTGELTLSGKVLRIGGLREKVAAAKRADSSVIIFPKDNSSDWEELPEQVKQGIIPVMVDWYDEVFEKLFNNLSTQKGNSVWDVEFKKIDFDSHEKQRHNSAA